MGTDLKKLRQQNLEAEQSPRGGGPNYDPSKIPTLNLSGNAEELSPLIQAALAAAVEKKELPPGNGFENGFDKKSPREVVEKEDYKSYLQKQIDEKRRAKEAEEEKQKLEDAK